jgi:hypothetical protein
MNLRLRWQALWFATGNSIDVDQHMRPRETISSGIAASVIAHLSALMLVLLFTEVHTFGSVTAEPITVDLISQPEAAPSPKVEDSPADQTRQSSDGVGLPSNSAGPSSPPPAPSNAAAPERQPPLPRPDHEPKEAAVAPPRPSRTMAPTTMAPPTYVQPEPDLSLKYNVLLGLPPTLPVMVAKGPTDELFDASASEKVDVESSLIGQFRKRLKTCSTLPGSIAPSDTIKITLRAFMTPQGTLAREPLLIEGSASDKGPALMRSAISALEGCQPYAMLPADRYGEWKVLDLSFSPQDFIAE